MIKVPRPFAPSGNRVTVNFAAGRSPLFNKIRFKGTPQAVDAATVRVFNAGPDMAFVELVGEQGDQSSLIGSGIPLAPNTVTVFQVQGATFLSATTPSSATLYATPGQGWS